MSPAVVAQINRDVNKAMEMADVRERLASVGAEDGGGTPQQFADFMHAERVKWAKVIREANIKADL